MAGEQNGGEDKRAKLVIMQDEDGSISIASSHCDMFHEAPVLAYRALKFLEARQNYLLMQKFERELKPRVISPQ